MSGGPLDFPDDPSEEPVEAPATGAPARGTAPPGPPPPSLFERLRPTGSTRYGWLAALLVLVVIVWVSLSTLHSDGGGATGLAAGTPLPPFATPTASNPTDAGPNLAVEAGKGAKHAACTVRGPQILNSCQLAERGPVVLAFLVTGGGSCVTQLDRLQAVVRDFPGVQLAAVAFRSKRADVLRLAADHHWTFPIGMDPDNTITNRYGVLVCPQATYAYPGGEVRGTAIGSESEATLRGRVARLVAASRERGWTPS
jgi:peroxiredoxin